MLAEVVLLNNVVDVDNNDFDDIDEDKAAHLGL